MLKALYLLEIYLRFIFKQKIIEESAWTDVSKTHLAHLQVPINFFLEHLESVGSYGNHVYAKYDHQNDLVYILGNFDGEAEPLIATISVRSNDIFPYSVRLCNYLLKPKEITYIRNIGDSRFPNLKLRFKVI
ncbi:MAG: hypothetical protein UZ19_OD1000241 [Parcubacteria bacterium OLB19]|nr:MAG: hypothetical protein UZ19_OD1000241 [Parcubacteria bacterium OLB19]